MDNISLPPRDTGELQRVYSDFLTKLKYLKINFRKKIKNIRRQKEKDEAKKLIEKINNL